jgi:AbiU2
LNTDFENEVDEMIDVVTKLNWTYTIFCVLFEKRDDYSEARQAHPEFFISMYEALLCSFCNGVAILFREKEAEKSIYGLIKHIEKTKPSLAKQLNDQIAAQNSLLKKVRTIRNQVCAHRAKTKKPQEVFSEASLRLEMMGKVSNLARDIILELAGEAGGNRKINLENHQLNKTTLQHIGLDAEKAMSGFIGSL